MRQVAEGACLPRAARGTVHMPPPASRIDQSKALRKRHEVAAAPAAQARASRVGRHLCDRVARGPFRPEQLRDSENGRVPIADPNWGGQTAPKHNILSLTSGPEFGCLGIEVDGLSPPANTITS